MFGCGGSGGCVYCRSGVFFCVLGFSSFHTGWYVAGFVALVCFAVLVCMVFSGFTVVVRWVLVVWCCLRWWFGYGGFAVGSPTWIWLCMDLVITGLTGVFAWWFDFCGLVQYSAYCLGDFWFLWFLAGLSLFVLVVVSSAVVLCYFLGFEFW